MEESQDSENPFLVHQHFMQQVQIGQSDSISHCTLEIILKNNEDC